MTLRVLTVAMLAALAISAPAFAAQSSKPSAPPSVTTTQPEWVKRSNEYAQILLKVQAEFSPESASFFGIPGYDDKVFDLNPDLEARTTRAYQGAIKELQAKLAVEKDANVRQDLQIMIDQAQQQIDGIAISQKNLVTWIDVPGAVFQGIQGLLQDQTQADRRAMAVKRLEKYVGAAAGTKPMTQLAIDQFNVSAARPGTVMPSKLEVEDALAKTDIYIDGINKLFAKYKFTDQAAAALAAMKTQLTDYNQWTRTQVLPKARPDAKLPAEVYAFSLKQKGIDITPQQLIARAETQFMETRAAMRQLAPLVAKDKGLKVKDPTNYIEVIKALKATQIPNDKLEASYRTVIDAIDPIIRRERIVDVPNRPMIMRLASEAESAASPAPHFLPAPLIGNTGQQGQFVLPVTVKGADGTSLAYDDFSNEAARWTLSAHEGRPGHELQFTRMLERGVSLARSMFAFNSVNVEGWALYAEAEMVPYEPLDGQMIALQLRLQRAARAILDPMLNLGMIDRPAAQAILLDDVGLSQAMVKQELDRYMFNSPGQAGSYFYGYQRLQQLRMDTEIKLGKKFDRMAFNNFVLDQGMLPPDLLAQAVREQFIPEAMKSKN